MPPSSEAVVIVGGTGAATTIMRYLPIKVEIPPPLFHAVRSKKKVPVVVGMPDITPSGEIVSPSGRVLELRLQVMGEVPSAVSVLL